MVLAETTCLDVFWYSILFFFWILAIWIFIAIVSDVIRRDDLSGGKKAAWIIFVLLVPYLGVFVYLIARGPKMGERAIARQQAAEAQFKEYVQQTAGSGTDADELAKLHGLKESGAISDAEYASMKAKIIG